MVKMPAYVLKICLLTATAVVSATAFASEIFVSTSGSDSNSGSKTAPYKTLQKAVDSAAAGDTIRVLPGIYRNNITITTKATADKPLKIVGTRSDDGKYLTVLEAQSSILTDWSPAPEIGENVWKIKLAKRPDTVMLDGKMIAQINKFNMQMPRRKQVPEKLTQNILIGSHNPKNSKRISGLDLLATSKDHHSSCQRKKK